MSAACISEELFHCPICLEVFSEPVSIQCGHTFCKRCICQAWDTCRSCKCPLCNRSFTVRPQLYVNVIIAKLVSRFTVEGEGLSQTVSGRVDVQCDACFEPKLKAFKSCEVCLSSFCEKHLQPHMKIPGLRKHRLMEPVDHLEDRTCPTRTTRMEDRTCPTRTTRMDLEDRTRPTRTTRMDLEDRKCPKHTTKVK